MGTSQSNTNFFEEIGKSNNDWFNIKISQEISEAEMKRNFDRFNSQFNRPITINLKEYNEKKFKEDLEKQILPLYPSPEAQVIKTKSKGPTKPTPQSVHKIELDAQPIQGRNEAATSAFDGRKHILVTNKWPNSVHGVLAFKVKNITKWGTGILIGPHIVLTTGHNLYDHDSKKYAAVEDLQFLPGMNGQLIPFGVIGVEKYFVSPNFIKDKEKEDYGLLILKKRVGEVTGYFGLACLEPGEIKKKRINITGYPGDKVASKPNTYEMWGMEGEAAHIDHDRGTISYLIDTNSGQSGSGVWYQDGENYYVCGVHITGTQFVNTATLLTRAMYKQIHAWIQQAGSKESLLKLEGDKRLSFADKKINAKCISLLIKYDLDDLQALNLARKEIGDKEVKLLVKNVSWVNLSELYLWGNEIGAEGAKTLAQNTCWVNLTQLDLGCNNIGTEGAKALAQNSSWSNLSKLHLDNNDINDKGAKALAQNRSWINLSILHFGNNPIGAEGAKALAQNPSWFNLSNLYLDIMNSSGEERIPLQHEYHRTNNNPYSFEKAFEKSFHKRK